MCDLSREKRMKLIDDFYKEYNLFFIGCSGCVSDITHRLKWDKIVVEDKKVCPICGNLSTEFYGVNPNLSIFPCWKEYYDNERFAYVVYYPCIGILDVCEFGNQ